MLASAIRSSLLLLLLGGRERGIFLPGSRAADAGGAKTAAAATTTVTSTASSEVVLTSARPPPNDVEGEAANDGLVGKSANKEEEGAAATIDHGRELMDWMDRTEGAFFHPHLTIRRMGSAPATATAASTSSGEAANSSRTADESSPSPFYGMYATGPIGAGEVLLEIPRSMVFHPDPPAPGDRVDRYFSGDDQYYSGVIRRVHKDGTYTIQYDDDSYEVEAGVDPDDVTHESYPSCCATVRKLIREMRLGSESFYGPYVQYLLSQPPGQLPTSWSLQGQALLQLVLGGSSDGDRDQDIQPYGSFGWVEEDWHGRCKGGKDALSEQAYLLLAQRGWDEVMIPVMDMLSHRNPPYLNTDHDPIRDGESVKLRATKDIQAGDEIYTSYNFCADCSARTHNYGTPEILRDYGFVEDYPQRWYFQHPRMSFDILPVFASDEDGNGALETGQTRVQWSTRPATRDGPQFLRDQRRRLVQLQQTIFAERDVAVPVHEWDVVRKFVDAMVKAYGDALESLQAGEDTHEIDMAACEADGSCHVQGGYDVYRDLLVATEPEVWGDDRPHTCDTKKIYDFDNWVTHETIESPYQTLGYATVPAGHDDVCFDLDDVVQICASYRPHYHEMMVHFAAQFVDKVRRIVFVGGGDSMLLHEALKYRDLELVVGLELDQVVPRNSYRYFATQPHFGDPRVEWWFGDATKSLMMLPSEYFGSFDLVLVDLSETVQALSVTDGLNVMEALALLVKPDGVLVQNEYMHFLEQASIFRHSLHVHFDSVPIVCSQSLILASNGINFLRGGTTDHHVDTLYSLLDEDNLRYDIVRDYQGNHTNPHHCSAWSDGLAGQNTSTAQLQSPGILLVVDAEGVSVPSDPESARDSIVAGLQGIQGIDVISTATASPRKGNAVTTISLRNGYVVARTWPDLGYCAFDVHFWSLYHLQEAVRSVLVTAMGSNGEHGRSSAVTSSYRIVASGVFGSDSWRDDETRRGPQLSKLCPFPGDVKDNRKPAARFTSDTLSTVLRESVALVPDADFEVLILCGRSPDDCTSVAAIQKEEKVRTVLSVQPCFDLQDDTTYVEIGAQSMMQCEKAIKEQLKESGLSSIRLIALDPSAPYSLAQIVARIFSSEANVERWLDDNIVAQAAVLDGATWRKTFADRFRTHVFDAEPVFTFDTTFLSEDALFEFVVTSSGDAAFPDRFVTFAQSIEKQTGLASEIRKVRSGDFTFQHEFEPDQVFTTSDYDNTDALQQWNDQLPVGLQTIFQFETMDKHIPRLSKQKLEKALKYAFKSAKISDLVLDSSTVVADGCLVFAHWESQEGGNAALLWDGRLHVDLNLFTYQAERGEVFADRIESATLEALSDFDFDRVLRDEQPRGTGRVVLYPKPHGLPTLWTGDSDVQEE